MTPFQKNKLENSLRLLKILLGLLLEMKDWARKNLKGHKTLMVEELLNVLVENEPIWVITRKHTNQKTGKEDTFYDARPMVRLVAQMISDIEEELRVLGEGGKDAA